MSKGQEKGLPQTSEKEFRRAKPIIKLMSSPQPQSASRSPEARAMRCSMAWRRTSRGP